MSKRKPMTYCDEHEGGCGASLTETDFDAGYCTQCKRQLTIKETRTVNKSKVKPLAKPSEKPASDKWVTCRKHFGVHLERVNCEKPRV